MTPNRPRRSEFSGRRSPPSNPDEQPDRRSDRGEARTSQHRRRSAAQPRQQQPRRILAAGVIIALALIAGVIFAGVHLIRSRHPIPSPSAAAPTQLPTRTVPPTATPPPLACGVPESFLTTMPAREKLAQLLMVGVTDAVTARRVVSEHVGGIFITSWTDLSMLKDGELKSIAGTAGPLGLAVSVDEEGGRVQRLSSLIDPEPSARVLAKTTSRDQTYQLAKIHGQKMRDLGITIDFAPVVDVTDAADDTVIGDRSFSNDPVKVTQYAGEYARGLRDAGVLPVLKHFPGHGHASGDSHMNGVVTPPLDALRGLDLEPYQTLAADLPVGVMIGHMVVPGLTEGAQASLSPAAYDLLRKGVGYGGPPFNGPVFTDDLSTMKAITDIYKVPDAVLKALQAGADTALWVSSAEVPAVLDRLVAALDGHELSMANIDQSVRRMAKAKGFSRCGQ